VQPTPLFVTLQEGGIGLLGT